MNVIPRFTKAWSIATLGLALLAPASFAAIGAPQERTRTDPGRVLLAACPPRTQQLAQPLPKAQPRKQEGKAVTEAKALTTAQIRGLRKTGTDGTASAKGSEMRASGPCAPADPSM